MTMNDLILGHAPRAQMAARLAAVSDRPDVECYFFGSSGRGGGGHILHGKPPSCSIYDLERTITAALGGIDTALCWNSRKGSYASEGRAFRTHRNGWTAIAFWDRTGDPRPACNSAFICRGELTFAQVVRVSRHRPSIWTRFTFPIVEVDRSGREVTR